MHNGADLDDIDWGRAFLCGASDALLGKLLFVGGEKLLKSKVIQSVIDKVSNTPIVKKIAQKLVQAQDNLTGFIEETASKLKAPFKETTERAAKQTREAIESVAKQADETLGTVGQKVDDLPQKVDNPPPTKRAIADTENDVKTPDPVAPPKDEVPPQSDSKSEFFIDDWTGYPDAPKPDGPFRILEGTEYTG